MANKVTGMTDTSGALSVAPRSPKSVLIIGKVNGTQSDVVTADTIFTITGTADAKAKFGDTSDVPDMVKILITNGVNRISGIVIGNEGETDADKYDSALTASMLDKNIEMILLDTNDATVVAKVKEHLITAEGEDLFRYSVIAPDPTLIKQTDLVTLATTINSNRIFIPGNAFVDADGNTVKSVLTAAGLASAIMTEKSDPALPMNGVQIRGFAGVSRMMLASEMDVLVDNGITPLYNEGGLPTIHRLVTSDVNEDKIWQEGTTRFIADYTLETVQNTLRDKYKRTKNVIRILDSIRTTVKSTLETLEGLEIIENFDASTLTVVKDPSDLYGALIDYEFDVVTPLYRITIKQHMKL